MNNADTITTPQRRVWITLALILILLLPPLLINVHKPSPTRIMEVLSFFSSQETWLNMQEDSGAWKMPTWNGKPRVEKPPLLVWLNLIAWSGLDPETASVDDLAVRTRLLAVGFALLAIAGAYWAGMTLGGIRTAAISALATGSGIFFIRQARYASYDTHIMGWTTLAVAAGLWAMRADNRYVLRIYYGWIICCLALTAANYTKGPLGFALVVPPLAVAVMAFTESRVRNIAALALTALISGALLAPWFVIVAHTVPEAGTLFATEYKYIFEVLRSPFSYLAIVGFVFPWTLWLIAGLVMPFANSEAKKDRGYWFAWGWLIILLIVLTLSPVKNKRYIVPALPAAGLLIAYCWDVMGRELRAGKQSRWFTALRCIHWGILLLASVLLPVFIVLQERLFEEGVIRRIATAGLTMPAAIVTGLLLCIIVVMGFRAHTKRFLARAAMLTALWMIVAATFGYYGYAQAPHQFWPHRVEVESLAKLTEGTPLYYMSRYRWPDHEAMPGHEFLIYYRGIVPEIALDGIRDRIAHNEPFYLMTRATSETEARLEQAGLKFLFTVQNGRLPDWKLYTYEP